MMNFIFDLPVKIAFGSGKIADQSVLPLIPAGEKALVITHNSDEPFELGQFDKLHNLLSVRGVASMLYDMISPCPSVEEISGAVDAAREGEVDFVVGLGGPGAMDAAKIVSAAMANGGELKELFSPKSEQGGALPVMTVPVSCSGAGTDQWALASDNGCPVALGKGVYPQFCLCDPDLLDGMPMAALALNAMHTVVSAAQIVAWDEAQPAATLLALESLSISAALLQSIDQEAARETFNSGMAWSGAGLGLAQALGERPYMGGISAGIMAAFTEAPRGLAPAMVGPAWMRRMEEKFPDKISDLASALSGGEKDFGLDEILKSLGRESGLSGARLDSCGIPEDYLPELAKTAHDFMEGETYENLLKVLESAWKEDVSD